MIALYHSGSANISTLQMVYYDPKRPHRAVIEPRGALMYVFIVLIAAGSTSSTDRVASVYKQAKP